MTTPAEATQPTEPAAAVVTGTAYPTESYTWLSDPCECSDPACPRSARLCFVWPERITTVNVAVRSHWRKAAAFTAEWRDAFALMAKGCVPLAWCNVTVQYVHGTNRKMDVGAEALATKAAIDGIVDGGVLPDDNPAYVRSVKYLAPVYVAGEERLIVTLDGPVAPCVCDFEASSTGGLCDTCGRKQEG